jgi:Ohr subfamily peroxiredoxin
MAYTTTATTKGGRDGRAVLANGGLALAMALPKDMGGSGEGHNPEQLFALGWSSCFGQAVLALSKKHGVDGSAARVTCAVSIDKDETSFALKAELKLAIPGVDKAKLQALIEDAHRICPYSRATRDNVPVTLTVE